MSNFGNGFSSEDIVVNAVGTITKRWGPFDRNTALTFGLLYGTQLGEPSFLPVISLHQKLNEHWSYTLGLPITGLTYIISEKHLFMASAMPEGLYGNNSNQVIVEGNQDLSNTKLQFNGFNTSLAYRYKFVKHLALTVKGGFIPGATLKILDSENEFLYDLNPGSGAYFNIGISLIMRAIPLKKNKNTSNDDY